MSCQSVVYPTLTGGAATIHYICISLQRNCCIREYQLTLFSSLLLGIKLYSLEFQPKYSAVFDVSKLPIQAMHALHIGTSKLFYET